MICCKKNFMRKVLTLLVFFSSSSIGFCQGFLFKYNTGINGLVGDESLFCHVYPLGPLYIGFVLECFQNNTDFNESRFYVFDLKGNKRLEVSGKDLGWATANVEPSATGSFLLYGYDKNYVNLTGNIFSYKAKTKSWVASPNLGGGVVSWTAYGNISLSSSLYGELKKEFGELVLYIYRY